MPGRFQLATPLPLTARPPQAPLDVDGYPVAPEGLELEQVHIYIRHGRYSTFAWISLF
jgi:acid phosphatase